MAEETVDYTEQRNVTRILTGMNSATKASDYADTIVFEPSQISGTRYKYTLTNAPDPRE